MELSTPFGAHPEWFGPITLLAFGAAYMTAVVVGYRCGWPPAAWLLVLAAAGIGGVVGTRLLPLGLDGLRVLWETGALPEAGVRRIPGTIVGALLAAEGVRRLLGVRQSMLDPFAWAGLVGLVVARLGCLLAGCCFGTPTDLPWGITYAEGSFVHGFHLAHGIVEAGSAGPAAVHPIPFYDLAFALVVLALLPAMGRRLRASGSLCGVVVGLYAAHRFVQDVVRADEVAVWGGLTAVQLGMAAMAVAATVWVVVAERRARGLAPVPDWAEPSAARLVAVLMGALAVRVALDGWLTTSEAAVLLVRLVPAIGAVAVVVVRRSAVPRLRWTVAAAASAIPLVVGFQTLPEPEPTFDLWAVDVHGDLGRYEETDVCNPRLYEYASAGGGVAHVRVDLANEATREIGVRVMGGEQSLVGGTPPSVDPEEDLRYGAVIPYVQFERRTVGVTLGAQVGRLPLLGPDAAGSPVLPVVGVRLGPRETHVQAGFLDAPHFGVPGSVLHLGVGTGRLTASGQEVRVQAGVVGSGVYLSGAMPLSDRVLIEPIGSIGGSASNNSNTYQLGIRLRATLDGD